VVAQKARGPAADDAAREPRAGVSAGELRSREATFLRRSCLAAVFAGQTCIGFLLSRGKLGFEAFDHDEHSLGVFPSMKLAAAAVSCAFYDGGER
jgi:hypothetical protein